MIGTIGDQRGIMMVRSRVNYSPTQRYFVVIIKDAFATNRPRYPSCIYLSSFILPYCAQSYHSISGTSIQHPSPLISPLLLQPNAFMACDTLSAGAKAFAWQILSDGHRSLTSLPSHATTGIYDRARKGM